MTRVPVRAAPAAAAEALARFGTELTYEDLPARLVDRSRLSVLDAFGCGLAARARGHATSVRTALREAYTLGAATVLGDEDGLPAPAAACVNGALCHALDFDDTHPAAVANVGAVVVPAMLAAAESTPASGRECLVALVLGSEIVVRLGLAAAPAFMRSGFHPTSVCGVFGAAAVAARIRRLDVRQTCHALAIAGSMASGLYEHFEDGSSTKVLHPGWAAQAGLLATAFASRGLDGPPTVLDGRFGVIRSHFGLPAAAVAAQLDGLGEHWVSEGIGFRPYPACNMLQSSLDCARTALAGRTCDPEEIREVRVSVPAAAAAIVLEPIAVKRCPRNPYDARFSLPYSIASMIVRGHVDLDSYTEEAIADPAVLAVANRVAYVPGDFPTFPEGYPSAVEIETARGTTVTARLDHHRGGPANPMTTAEVLAKFRANAGEALGPHRCDALEGAVMSLGDAEGIAGVSAAL